MLWGPRQVGKTTLLDQLHPKSSLFLDDLGLRQNTQADAVFILCMGFHLKRYCSNCWCRAKNSTVMDRSFRKNFILQIENKTVFIEAKLGIHGVKAFDLDVEAKKVFSAPCQKIVVHVGSLQTQLNTDTLSLPIQSLGSYLNSAF